MIFHTPYPLTAGGDSGSHIRPVQMLKAFKELGYEVHEITGYGQERWKSLKALGTDFKKGNRYEFIYSETSTMPMFLTEKNHLPIFFFVEIFLFVFCKRKNIPVSIYYRDIHWKYNFFQRGTSDFKRIVALVFYYFELITIKVFCDLLFLPSLEMQREIPLLGKRLNVFELPPGTIISKPNITKPVNNGVNLIYVGGINPPIYDISMLLEAVKSTCNVHLHLVCRKEDIKNIDKHSYMHSQISIYHVSGEELENIYNKADFAVVALGDHKYHDFSMPVKMFEAIGYGKPILTSTSMKAASRFIIKNKVGIAVNNLQEMNTLLKELVNKSNPSKELFQNIHDTQKSITWVARANEVQSRIERINHES